MIDNTGAMDIPLYYNSDLIFVWGKLYYRRYICISVVRGSNSEASNYL